MPAGLLGMISERIGIRCGIRDGSTALFVMLQLDCGIWVAMGGIL